MPEDEPTEPEGNVAEGCAPGDIVDGETCLVPGIEVCAEGFEAFDGGCVAVLPEAACENGTMALPGDAYCYEPAPCGDSVWGEIPLEANTHYVDAAYAGTSTGSQTQPWRTIQDAIDNAPAGGQIAVAAGVYAEALVIRNKAVRVWGRCPTMVQVGVPNQTAVSIETLAHGSEIHNLGLSGSFGVANGGSTDVLVEGAWIHDTTSRGVITENTLAEASTIVRHTLIDRASEIGASAFGSTVTIEDSVIRNTQQGGGSGRGISVRGSSTLTVRHSVIENNVDLGILVSGSTGLIERTLVRDTQPNGGLAGGGITFQPDSSSLLPASGTIDTTVVERNYTYGILVHGSAVGLTRVSVRDVWPQALDQSVGVGIQIQADDVTGAAAEVTMSEILVERAHYGGISATGATLDVHRALIRDLYPEPRSGEYGRGVLAFYDAATQQGVYGSFRGLRIERAVEAGLFAQGVELTLEDVAVSGTYARADGEIGRGICFQSENETLGSVATLSRIWIDENFDAGLLLEGTHATVNEIMVVNTYSTVAAGKFGDAIQVLGDPGFPEASALIQGAYVEGSHRAGVAVYGAAVSIQDSALECNPIDLNGQDIGERMFAFTDEGGNQCGCGGEQKDCRVLSTDLEPPRPME